MKIGLLKRDLNCNAWTTENLGDYYTGQSNFSRLFAAPECLAHRFDSIKPNGRGRSGSSGCLNPHSSQTLAADKYTGPEI